MIRRIVGASMRMRLVVAAAAALLLVFGFTQLLEIPVDALPEFSRPYVEIQIEALGLSAQEVEAMITTPLEADMLNGCPWAAEIRSVSLPGLSTITLTFEKGTDIMRARQVAQERLIEIFALPQVSNQFTMVNPVSSSGRVMEIGLTSEQMSLIEMSVLARWTIAPKLMGLPGVANVSIWGERQRQLQVQVDPAKLRAEGVTLMDIIKTAGNSLWASPLSFLEASTPGTGGWIDTPNQRLTIRHILPITTAANLARVPIEGSTKRLGDVATVVEDHQPLIGDAIIKNEPSLMLVVEKFPWANTTEVTSDVEEALADLSHGLAGMEMDPTLFRPATFVEQATSNFGLALLIGVLLMVGASFAFFANWRMVLVVTSAVLLSLFAAGTVLYVSGVTLNMMLIAGLLMALGAIVDMAIGDMKNIIDRLRKARESGDLKPANTIFAAVTELRGTLLYALVILLLTVVPVYFLEGVSLAFFQPVATAFILALLAATLVAITATPALTVLLLRKFSAKTLESPFTQVFRGIYKGLYGWVFAAPRAAFTVVCLLFVAGLASVFFLHQGDLLPDFKETDLVVHMQGSSSASHPAMSRIVTLAGQELRGIPGVKNVSAHLGRAIMSDKMTNVNNSELWISIDPTADYEATVAEVKRTVAGYPGLSPEVLTNLRSQVRDELAGRGEALVVRVYGEDMDMIRKKADEVQNMLSGIDGIASAQVLADAEMPTLEIEVDMEKAKQYNLKPGDIRRAATSLVSGIVVGALFEEQKVFDVVVWGTPDTRHSITNIQNLLIDTPAGGQVHLQDVANVRIVPSVTEIHRDAVARRVDVIANARGRDYNAIAADIDRGIKQINFPLEYRAELLGEYAENLAAKQRVAAFGIAAAIGIFLLLQVYFRSWRLASIVFFSIPTALLGSVLLIFLTTGGLLSFGSILGLIAVLAVTVHYAFFLISQYRLSEKNEDAPFAKDLVQRITLQQSPRILQSATAIALVFLPMIVVGNVAGLEIAHPLSVAVLGGLFTATFYALGGVPAIYLLFGAAREPELELDFLQERPITVVSDLEVQALSDGVRSTAPEQLKSVK